MGDLEENIFKENIPGRWSTFEKHERSDVRHDEAEVDADDDGDEGRTYDREETAAKSYEDEMIDYARTLNHDGMPESIAKTILARRLTQPATGVKGVLADYKTHRELEAAMHAADHEARDALIRRMVEGHKIKSEAVEEEVG
jgi:hypothetical protein